MCDRSDRLSHLGYGHDLRRSLPRCHRVRIDLPGRVRDRIPGRIQQSTPAESGISDRADSLRTRLKIGELIGHELAAGQHPSTGLGYDPVHENISARM
ncbi:hypothetical protein [Nocardia sp.]|uniref:hypothetical protein n=1 Tax=Nocardia sp. TaxID=1821 RepID=UPI002638CF29|nr:hypothetical protein [Nocardia sp.]